MIYYMDNVHIYCILSILILYINNIKYMEMSTL